MTGAVPGPILVTGAHRTGTTWVGKILASGDTTAYLSEPLNVLHRPGVLSLRIPRWYAYICSDNEGEYLPAFKQLLTYDYHLLAEWQSLRSVHDGLRMMRDVGTFLRGRVFHLRPIIKDPFAVFSLPWFAERLHSTTVVTIRHPGAFASSLKRLNWTFDFRDLLDQPLLMRDYLESYRKRMQGAADSSVIEQAGLLWAMIYGCIHLVRIKYPSIRLVRHEDFSVDPVPRFRQLYEDLGLEFTPAVERRVVNSSSSKNPSELTPGKVHSVMLDSRASLETWRLRLSSSELDQVRKLTADVAAIYYPESTWN